MPHGHDSLLAALYLSMLSTLLCNWQVTMMVDLLPMAGSSTFTNTAFLRLFQVDILCCLLDCTNFSGFGWLQTENVIAMCNFDKALIEWSCKLCHCAPNNAHVCQAFVVDGAYISCALSDKSFSLQLIAGACMCYA